MRFNLSILTLTLSLLSSAIAAPVRGKVDTSAVTVRTVGFAREMLPKAKERSLIGSIVSGIEKLAGKAAKSSVKAAQKEGEKVAAKAAKGAKRRRRRLNIRAKRHRE